MQLKTDTIPSSVYLFTLPWRLAGPGGVNEVVKNLYRSLDNANSFTPVVLTQDWQPNSGDNTSTTALRTIPFPLYSPCEARLKARMAFLLRLPVTLFRLRQIFRKMRVEVVNPHFPGMECIHFFMLRWLGIFRGRIILSFHGSDVVAVSKSAFFERRLWAVLLRSADANVCCSRALARRLVDAAPAAEKKIAVVWNGIETEEFFAQGKNAPLGLPIPTGRYLVSIGAFDRKKGHDILINAFDRLRSEHPDLKLVIAGKPGELSASIREQIESMNLMERVILLENLPHSAIPELMRRATVFVLPSRTEGFPLVLLEAGACGKPVVATAVGGVPELVTDRGNGRIVPSEDPEALARAINDLLDDDYEAGRLGQALQRKVTEEFTLEQARNRYLELSCD